MARPSQTRRPRLHLEHLEDRATPAQIGLEATDVLVNATGTAGQQGSPRVAMKPDGTGFVVVWQGPDGGGGAQDNGVFARVYNANWQPLGGEIPVNTVTADIQSQPAVAVDAAGNFVVAWKSRNQAGASSGFDVIMRGFNADGTPRTSEFLVNTTTALDQQDPAIAMNATGRFVVTWFGGPFLVEDVFARVFSLNTSSFSAFTGEITVNATTADEQSSNDVAIDAAGNFVVAWQSFAQDGSNYGVYARRFTAAGSPTTAETQVNVTTAGNQQLPRVGLDSAGNTTVVWQGQNTPGGSGFDVVQRRFNASLAAFGGETLVNATTADSQSDAEIDVTAAGDYVVVWRSANQEGAGSAGGVYARRYDSAGAAVGGEVPINLTTAGEQGNPAVGVTAAGDYAVAFEGASGTVSDVFLRRFGEAPVVAFTAASSAGTEAANAAIGVTRAGAAYVLANVATPVTVNRTGGTATPGADFTTTFPQTVTFPATGSASQTLAVAVVDDATDEPDQTIALAIGAMPAAYTVGAQSAHTYTIQDDDAAPTISVSSPTVTEGNSGNTVITFTLTLSAASEFLIQTNVATADGTATVADGDYAALSGGLNIAPGQVSQIIQTAVVGDTKNEADETFTITLSGTTNTANATASGTGTIINDDPVPTLSINSVSVTEGNSGTTAATFTVSLSAASGQTVTVNFATADGTATAPSDYVATSGTLTFAPGQTTQTIAVTVNGDTTFEPDETFTVNLSGPTNATIGTATGTGTITNDDPAATLSINSVSVSEGAGTATFTVTLSPANPSATVAVNFATANGTAIAGSDYGAQSGTVTFAPGQTAHTITIAIVGDTLDEADETFTITLSNPTNAGIGTGTGTGTILDDDPAPTIAINSVSVVEGDAGTTAATFTVTLSAASGQTVTVTAATADGTATAPSDYAAVAPTVITFAPGQTTQTVTVLVNGDTAPEPTETFAVNLSGAVNATIATGTGTGTIANDDSSLSIDSVSVNEGAGTATFTVTLTPANALTVTVDFATADGTATAPGDYTAAAGTLTFAPGQTSQTITVAVADDLLDEADEAFTVTLSNPTNAGIGAGTGTGTILDNDPAPALSIDSASVVEGDSGTTTATFTVSLSAPSGQTVTVAAATADGTAAAPGDYAAVAPTVITFAPGQTTQTFSVTVNGDTTNEADETFAVTLSAAVNATIATAVGTGTITNDDAVPTLSIDSASTDEGDAGTTALTFTVTLSAASGQTVTVDFATADGTATTAGGDYVATTGTLTFAPGQTTQTISVTVNGDTTNEADETLTVELSSPTNATIATAVGTGTITNDDAVPALSIDDVSAAEGDAGTTTLTFTVSLSAASGQTVTVNFATAGGTATTAGGDYVAASGTLTFAPGQTTQTIAVTITGDTTFEADETFTVSLSAPTNATIDAGTGTGTITNDDFVPAASVTGVGTAEGDTGTTALTFTVTLSNPSALPVTVDFTTSDDTATVVDGDYTAASGTLTFAPGQTTRTFTVNVGADTRNETDERFGVTLSNPTNATIGTGTAVGVIANDDPVPTLSIDSVSAAEGDAGTTALTFTVTLSAASGQTVTVDFATADGTATAGSDYTAAAGTLTFAPGQTTQTVTVAVSGDTTFEPDETLTVQLSNPTNATIAADTGTGTITNDDSTPVVTLTLDGSPFAENGGVATVTVRLANPAADPVTVALTFGGTAALGTDYTASATSVTIPAGQLSATVTLTGLSDAADEPAETVIVGIGTVDNGVAGDPSSVTAAVTDDDAPAGVPDAFATAEDTPLTVAAPGVLGNDLSVGTPTAAVATGPTRGTLTLRPDGGFTYTPNADFTGTDSFTYRVSNGTEQSAPVTVTITVTPVNDAPTFTAGSDQRVGRRPGAQSVAGWATGISAGPADEAGQTLAFLVTTDNPGLFAVAPAIDPATGTLTYTPTETGFGAATVSVRLRDDGGTAGDGSDTSAARTFTITVSKHRSGEDGPIDQNEFGVYAVGAGAGGPGTVTLYAADGTVRSTVTPFADGAGARAVVADVTGDGVADVVAATGPGRSVLVVVIDGATGEVVRTFEPFEATFTGGAFVAAGDVDADGFADVAVAADETGGARVVVYGGQTGAKLADFFGIEDPAFRGGARVALGDVNADGVADLAVAAGTRGGPRLAVWDGTSLRAGSRPSRLVGDFFVFEQSLRDGTYVTIGDLDGDGFGDVIVGGGPQGGPRVFALDGRALVEGGQFVQVVSFFADDPDLRAGGARLAAKDFDGDRQAELVVSVPTGSGSAVTTYTGRSLAAGDTAPDDTFDLLPGLASGVFVG